MDRISLAGEWQFREAESLGWLPATVPGGVYGDLLEAGEIPDPYYGDNELAVQWVGETDWEYRRTVDLDASFLEHDRLLLECNGLDTVAEIEVNGIIVGESANMHRGYEFDVKEALLAGENEIVVRFFSSVEYGLERRGEYPHEVHTTRYPVDQPARNFVRKAQCHYGWDWGICLPTVGIYRNIALIGSSSPRITHVVTAQEHADGRVRLEATVGVDAETAGEYDFTMAVAGSQTRDSVSVPAGTSTIPLELTDLEPELWWPNGYGDQPLYDLEIQIVDGEADGVDGEADGVDGEADGVDGDVEGIDGETNSVDGQAKNVDGGVESTVEHRDERRDERRVADAYTDRIGFRDCRLVREPDPDGDGESFYFEVNDTPVFAKGANWIPADALYANVTPETYRDRIESAVAANMNTIRVWGGGYYEREEFYRLCDERGLLVWQDFMFACALYPADEAFLANVESEVRHQVRRLANHPSIALWCGNNENEEAMKNWFEYEEAPYETYAAEYDALYLETVGRAVAEEDPSRTYWPSSPSSGAIEDPYEPSAGDLHYWDVWHRGAPFEEYLTVEPRFVSEFGYQSFPSLETLRSVMEEADLNPTAPLMEHHQRHPEGNALILSRMADHFRIPFSVEAFVRLSQIQHGLAMKTAIEHWRRIKPYCMGTLYWQLNDLWPVVSWSSLEYGGGWKALHHLARRFYAPVLPSITVAEETDRVDVWLTSDVPEPIEGTIRLEGYRFDETEPFFAEDRAVTLAAGASEVVGDYSLEELLGDRSPRDVLFRVRYDGGGERDGEAYDNHAFLAPYKSLSLPESELVVGVDGEEVTIVASKAALFVTLETPSPGTFSENYFHLIPGEEKRVTFEASGEGGLADLSVSHLRETY